MDMDRFVIRAIQLCRRGVVSSMDRSLGLEDRMEGSQPGIATAPGPFSIIDQNCGLGYYKIPVVDNRPRAVGV